METNYN